jgi:hypothetical protein
MELQRAATGDIHYYIGAPSASELDLTTPAFLAVFPAARVGPWTLCPVSQGHWDRDVFIRAIPRQKRYLSPNSPGDFEPADRASLLLRSLSASELRVRDSVLQLLFAPVSYYGPAWVSRTDKTRLLGSLGVCGT